MAVGSKASPIAVNEALRKARWLLDECQVSAIPVDLIPLAHRQGIRKITEMDTRLDGQLLELSGGGYEVILSRNAPATRKRFTLAHEIAHTLLEGGLNCGDGVTEESCNAAAAEILMPVRFLKKLFPAPADVTVESFLKASRSFQCSLEAAAWKLLNSEIVDGALLLWRLKGEAGDQSLELVSAPHTWTFSFPVKSGMVARPGEALWQELMAGDSPFELRNLCRGRSYPAERQMMNKMLLVLIRSRGVAERRKATRPAQEKFKF